MPAYTKARLAFFISGNGYAFRAVALAIEKGLIHAEIALVVCDRPSGLEDWCHRRNLNIRSIYRSSFDDASAFSSALAYNLNAARIDWLFLNFNYLVSKKIIGACDRKVINLHMSLLPDFKGFGAVKKTLQSKVARAGVTMHWAIEEADSGPNIAQSVVPVLKSDTEETLGKRLFKSAVPLQLLVARWASMGEIDPQRPAEATPVFDCKGPEGVPAGIDADLLEFSQTYLENLFGGTRPANNTDE